MFVLLKHTRTSKLRQTLLIAFPKYGKSKKETATGALTIITECRVYTVLESRGRILSKTLN